MNYCILGDKKSNICKKCKEGYFLSEFRDSCTNDKNCYEGDKDLGICLKCKEGFYLDYKDGICKSNNEKDEFKYCQISDKSICINFLYGYYLSEDSKCSLVKNCGEVYNGQCTLCINNYYLGLDNKCSNIENCIYTNYFDEFLKCKDNYYYNKKLLNVK